jgi:hypothetical protein
MDLSRFSAGGVGSGGWVEKDLSPISKDDARLPGVGRRASLPLGGSREGIRDQSLLPPPPEEPESPPEEPPEEDFFW